jgi:hypothetical protein
MATSGFQQQAPLNNLGFRKPTPDTQHGQKADQACKTSSQARSFQPRRPGH